MEVVRKNQLADVQVPKLPDNLPADVLKLLGGVKFRYYKIPEFTQPTKAESETILAEIPNLKDFEAKRTALLAAGNTTPPEMRCCYQSPLLSQDQEFHLFRKMNFFKHLASKAIKKENWGEAKNHLVIAREIRELLTHCNLRLVTSIAKQQREYFMSASLEVLADLIGDGSIGLVRAVDYFDFRRGVKFSTYATWVIRDEFRRSRLRRQRQSIGETNATERLEFVSDGQDGEDVSVVDIADNYKFILGLLESLQPRIQEIISNYYGLLGNRMKLQDIADKMDLSKERVRQLREFGLKQIRRHLRVHRRSRKKIAG